jgi:hypothetical protein
MISGNMTFLSNTLCVEGGSGASNIEINSGFRAKKCVVHIIGDDEDIEN